MRANQRCGFHIDITVEISVQESDCSSVLEKEALRNITLAYRLPPGAYVDPAELEVYIYTYIYVSICVHEKVVRFFE